MSKYYTNEKNVQVILSLLKQHGIRYVIASPGGTNVTLVASMKRDSFFKVFSSVDERSAAYLACGLAEESGEPVVISCTGATSSRNYSPGLTEAFYRKLPVLAITSTQAVSKVGHLVAQVIDRSVIPNDVANLSVDLPIVKDDDDLWECEIKVNQAILELTRRGGGPVHINLPTTYSSLYETKHLPAFRKVTRITPGTRLPEMVDGRIAIFVGSHSPMTSRLVDCIERFCAKNNGVVFCDHTSGYYGRYSIHYALVAGQRSFNAKPLEADLLIHIGGVSGDYYGLKNTGNNVWRVSEDGELRDTFRRLTYVFEMPEEVFFENYAGDNKEGSDSYLKECCRNVASLREKIPDLPFSNVWIASRLAKKIPSDSVIHFGILNSLRSWNFFDLPLGVKSYSNVGGFGIDGGLSSLVGASLFDSTKTYFCVMGDLAFFYDMNVVGNRHVGKNVRILLVNNGKGIEFRHKSHAAGAFGDEADEYIAASGHYGKKSRELVKNFAQDLGYQYLSASDKPTFEVASEIFVSPNVFNRPIIFEVFTNSEDETEALELMLSIEGDQGGARALAKQLIGRKGVKAIKGIISK